MTLFIYASAVLMVDFVGHEAETQEDTVIQERSVGVENCSILGKPRSTKAVASVGLQQVAVCGSSVLQ